MTRSPQAGLPLGRVETPRLVYGVIVACAVAGAALRAYQLSRPGYLLGVTEYDDGAQVGDAVRLVAGVVPYRDFVVLQPPGSVLLMVPAALLAKVTGTAWGLAVARVLTAAADTACIVLLGLLVRHRGPVVAGIACGTYAVYPDALVAAHTFLLEPWLNLFCLAGAVVVFDRDEVSGRLQRLGWGGMLFGVAAAVKLWAVVPLVIIGVLVAGRPRRLGVLAGGAAAGFGVLVLPFLVMAPGPLVKDVFVSQYLRADVGHQLRPLPRLSDLAGFNLDPALPFVVRILVLAGFAAIVSAGYLVACLAARRRPAALDWYALTGLVAVVGMLLWPLDYYSHYGAFAGPFIALVLALPVGLLGPAEQRYQIVPVAAVGLVAAMMIVGVGVGQFAAETRLRAWSGPTATAADRLIPAGSCVLTNNAALTISTDRFTPDPDHVPGCPDIVDPFGTYLAMTDGERLLASPQELSSVRAMWRSDFSEVRYVWIDAGSQAQIPWTPALYAYFKSHFGLIGRAYGHGARDAPRGGIYARRLPG
jgi:hypothetical protein